MEHVYDAITRYGKHIVLLLDMTQQRTPHHKRGSFLV